MLYFIVNEHSRSGRAGKIWKEVRNVLKERDISYHAYRTEYAGQALRLAHDICEREKEIIRLVVVGGDGTVNEVINGIPCLDRVRLGVIPTGSGNDFARGLNIKGTPAQILETILNCEQDFVMDIGEVWWDGCERPRRFAISAGMGMDALVCKKAMTSKLKKRLNKLHLGKMTYLILTVQSLFTMSKTDGKASFEDTKKTYKGLIFSAVMNLRAEGGGVPMAPSANVCDGKLSVCTVWGFSKIGAMFFLPMLVMAKHEKIRGAEVKDCEYYTLKVKEPMVLHADGEYCANVTEAKFRCLKGVLHIVNCQTGQTD